jgi:hypothetical protein
VAGTRSDGIIAAAIRRLRVLLLVREDDFVIALLRLSISTAVK